MSDSLFVNLDDLVVEARIVIAGSLHTVKPMSAKMLTVLRKDGDNLEKLLTVVANRVPSLAREALEELSIVQLEKLLDISMASVKTAEQAAPNGEAPATSTPA